MGFVVTVVRHQADREKILIEQVGPLCQRINESGTDIKFFPLPGKLIDLLKMLTTSNIDYELTSVEDALST